MSVMLGAQGKFYEPYVYTVSKILPQLRQRSTPFMDVRLFVADGVEGI